jgi:hypothetical protein
MVDAGKMTDQQLEDRIQLWRARESMGLFGAMLCVAGALCTAFSSFGLAVVFLAGTFGMYAGAVKAVLTRRCCEQEMSKRHPRQPQYITRAEPAEPLPKVAHDFNPAAATVLDKNIQPMAPLRLKLKPEM